MRRCSSWARTWRSIISACARGLADRFGRDRVRDTPICELGFTGAGVGAAMAGFRPIVDLRFMDFTTYALDPIVNQAAKLRYMLGGQLSVPMVARIPSGAGLQYGATHGQSLEAWFMQVPGLEGPLSKLRALTPRGCSRPPSGTTTRSCSSSTGCSTRKRRNKSVPDGDHHHTHRGGRREAGGRGRYHRGNRLSDGPLPWKRRRRWRKRESSARSSTRVRSRPLDVGDHHGLRSQDEPLRHRGRGPPEERCGGRDFSRHTGGGFRIPRRAHRPRGRAHGADSRSDETREVRAPQHGRKSIAAVHKALGVAA